MIASLATDAEEVLREPLLAAEEGGLGGPVGRNFEEPLHKLPSANSWLEGAAEAALLDERDGPAQPGGARLRAGLPAPHVRVPAVKRDRANTQRCQVRDDWNLRELQLEESLQARQGLVDEEVMRQLCHDVLGGEAAPSSSDLGWLLRLADPCGTGVLDPREVHGALLSWHGYRSIQRESLRLLAELPFARTVHADTGKLRLLMERLNAPLPVEDEEVEMVLAQASLVGDGRVSRPELIRGLGAWYPHVERARTPLGVLLRSGVSRCLPEQEHHLRVMARLAQLAPLASQVAERASASADRASHGGQLAPPDADGDASVNAACLACHIALLVAMHTVLLVALVLPSGFFAWLVYLGCAHGSALCRYDLDALLVWYGALGIAMLAVGCADVARGPGASCAAWAIRGALLALPWLGASWTFRLSEEDVVVCGRYMSRVSGWVWGFLLSLEVYLVVQAVRGVAATYQQEVAARMRSASA